MASARIEILNQVPQILMPNTWNLCFQESIYHYDNGTSQHGYRFIWRRPNNTLQAARGQARLPDQKTIDSLLNSAKALGWYK